MTGTGRPQNISPLRQSVRVLNGVGPERAIQLARLQISSIEDLLLHAPRRYEDRSRFRPIAQLEAQESALTRGKIVAMGVKYYRQRQKSIFEIVVDDGSARLHCRWWNLPFMEKYFSTGDEVVVFGRVLSLKPRTMDHPETEVVDAGEESSIHLNRIAPIYPLTEGLPQRWLRALIWRTLAQLEGKITEPFPDANEKWRAALQPSRVQAIRQLHFPNSLDEVEPARRRLALDEFLELQCQIQLRRRNFQSKASALPCGGNNRLMKPFLAQLGFRLTDSQTRVLRELRKDLCGQHPMRRLLQGDVGSGKTVVAACCALMALESGYNAALMAPTEILAEQHYQNFRKWFEPLGVSVEMRTGSQKDNPKSRNAEPEKTLYIGTHALITPGWEMPRLGLVIIDEQHKFGVVQREEFVRKGRYPHLLVMTATPIPRTLGLTLYGELDGSVIDELPPGRGKVMTFVRPVEKLPKVWDFIREKLAQGRQAYVVYPRVEESGQAGLKAVTQEFDTLQEVLRPFRTGLIHGRLRSQEKEAAMLAFRNNSIQVLLATSLIEVGVDVPNATVMLIENAEQFGLAQLHQLRGRIGRGAHDSYCILVASARSKESRNRLKVMEETTDGFRIAEADLKLRGPGELLGQQQSGVPRFRFGNLDTDLELILKARMMASEMG